ncbi:methyl-accepting chemotaxis protein [Salipaludibacillus daqingensis]|uniref:methyl-accepting chemotaxis protein n=1 Tax=Salipaludibacillus daqingensis TaxID=3041001 RepID=UPI002472F7FA|nr:methyl-accepting chemotaxis protein [Salipaludibacillus daqingensis]
MDQKELVLKSRNKLISKLLWFAYFLGLGSNFLAGVPMEGILAYGLVGLFAVGSITYVTFMKPKWASYVQYVVAVNFTVLIFFMVSTSPKLSNYMMIYVAIAFITLYHNSKSIALSALLGLGLSNYFFVTFQEEMFYGAGFDILISLNVMFIVITSALITQARIGEKMQENMDTHYEEISLGKKRTDELLEKVNDSISVITSFSESLKGNLSSTEHISNELTTSYVKMAKGVEESAASVSNIHNAVYNTTNEIENVDRAFQEMSRISAETVKATEEGDKRVVQLNEQMSHVAGIIDHQSKVVTDLYSQSEEISSILATITSISEQTNLLALNASIEAARAGEHGKGFAVVADEVRKLAETSQSSTQQISSILKDIHEKVELVKNQVDESKRSVKTSIHVTTDTKGEFSKIEKQAKASANQSELVSKQVLEMNLSSEKVLEEINQVASFTQQSSASVEEMQASVEEQNDRIQSIVESFSELESLTRTLRDLSKKAKEDKGSSL